MTNNEIILLIVVGGMLILSILLMFFIKKCYVHRIKMAEMTDLVTNQYTLEGFEYKLSKLNKKSEVSIIKFDIADSHGIEAKLGNAEFKKLIKQISDYIYETLSEKEFMSHYNFDNFLICLEQTDPTVITNYVENIKYFSLQLSNTNYTIDLYTGVATGKANVETLANCVSAWKYAKRNKIKLVFYDETVYKTEEKFHKIIENPELISKEFSVYYQPKVNATTGEIEGAEALARWVDDQGNIVMYPNEFIREFEINGLITKLDMFVFEEVCKLLESFKKRGQKEICISLNLSRINFQNQNLVAELSSIMEKYNFNKEYLHIEVTESAYMNSEDFITNSLLKLKEIGILTEMDDFGSGYSSFGSLLNSKCDIVKIDRFLVENNLRLKSEQVILESLIKMFTGIGLRVVVEGVESAYVVKQIRKMAPNVLIQGYYFFKPMPLVKLERILIDNCYVLDDVFKEEVVKEEIVQEDVVVVEPIKEVQNEKVVEIVSEPEPIVVEEVVEEEEEIISEPEPEPVIIESTPEVEEEPEDDEVEEVVEVTGDDQEDEEEKILRLIEEYKKRYQNEWEAEILKKYPELMKKHYERREFSEKLMKLDQNQKDNYNTLKNEIMKHGLKNRTTKYFDTFIYKTTIICKIGVVGKSIRLYLALNPNDYPEGQFPHKDVSNIKRHEKTPYLMKIASNLSVRRGLKLINDLMTIYQLDEVEDFKEKNYVRGIQLSMNRGK